MGAPTTPRSVNDATRFTAQTPHVSSKGPSNVRKLPASRRIGPSKAQVLESPEERILRLRQAHLAAQNIQATPFERLVVRVRPILDTAHRVTLMGLMGFSVVAFFVTAYTAYDMYTYSRYRKEIFFQLCREMDNDSVTAARIAYMKGEATDAQANVVEYYQKRAAKDGVKMPPLFHPGEDEQGNLKPLPPKKVKQTWREWIFSTLKREEEGEDFGSSEARLGYESLNEEDDAEGVRESDIVRAVEDKQAFLKEKAREAFDKEREKEAAQKTMVEADTPAKKKGWW